MPRIQITFMGKIALVVLRLYLLILLTLIGISFYRLYSKHPAPAATPAPSHVSTAAAAPHPESAPKETLHLP